MQKKHEKCTFFSKYLVISKKSSTFAPAFEKKARHTTIGAVVQLVRIHACHAWGRGFESRPHRKKQSERVASFVIQSHTHKPHTKIRRKGSHEISYDFFGAFCSIDFTKTRKTCYKTYFLCKIFGRYIKKQYLCTVFFMVLDLRLSKGLGCREDNPSFFYTISLI